MVECAFATASFKVMPLRSFSVWNSTRPLHSLSNVIVPAMLRYCDFDSSRMIIMYWDEESSRAVNSEQQEGDGNAYWIIG